MSPQPISPNHLDSLITEFKLLRILSPELKVHIRSHQAHSRFVLVYENELYLSLEHLSDVKQRQYFYQLIQQHQTGIEVDLSVLPGELQQILRPDMAPAPLFWGPLIVGAAVGLVIGVLAMALGMLFMNVTAVTLGNPLEPFSLQVPIIIFVFFAAIGWAVTSMIVWRRWKNPAGGRDLAN